MFWKPFQFGDNTYDLSHLHPIIHIYTQPAIESKPARDYKVKVRFSMHCFTRKDLDGADEPSLRYTDTRETRIFDFKRYELSRRLPDIVKTLMERKCYHTGHGNYFVVEVFTETAELIEYEVYFDVRRSSREAPLELMIQSAYSRDKQHLSSKPRRDKGIRLAVILFNKLTGRPIRVQK